MGMESTPELATTTNPRAFRASVWRSSAGHIQPTTETPATPAIGAGRPRQRALTVDERRAAIERFLHTYSGDYMRRHIRAAETPAAAIAFCVGEHRLGGADVQLAEGGRRHL